MAEEIINALTKLGDLRVVARTSAFQFKGQAVDLREVGKPTWETLPENIPSRVGNLVRRCLQKDPKNRVQAIGDVRLAMEGARFRSPSAAWQDL